MPTNYGDVLAALKKNSIGALARVGDLADLYRLVQGDLMSARIDEENAYLSFFETKYHVDLHSSQCAKAIVAEITRAALHIACV